MAQKKGGMGIGTVGRHPCSVFVMGYTGPLVCRDGHGLCIPEPDGSRALTKSLILLGDHDGAFSVSVSFLMTVTLQSRKAGLIFWTAFCSHPSFMLLSTED